MKIPVAHDYICPWCWIAVFQVKELEAEFGVEFDWLSYELMPENLPWDDAPSVPHVATNRPKTPSRMDLAWAAAGMEKPTVERPKKMRSHNALEATEYVKANGDARGFVEAMYRALWEEGREINALPVIEEVAQPYVEHTSKLIAAVERREFRDRIVPFDDEAYAVGVYNVPTYWIGDERYAEQPTVVLARAIRAVM
jgi:predicted DsbA family dithiol-disulfide isomerase